MTNLEAQKLGKLGGKRTLHKYGNEHFKRISKLAVEAKKLKKAQKTMQGA